MAFRKKADYILSYKPDILIVPECEHPDKLKFESDTPKPNEILWYGENKNKGLGIFSYSDFKIKLLKTYNPELKFIIPIGVTGGEYHFTLYAIWANNTADSDGQYIEQVWKAIHHYKNHLKNKSVMLIGDFNSNTIWDKKHRSGNHSNVVNFLEGMRIYSTYHLHNKKIQGKELHPTLYMYRHLDRPYHIDYCFVSEDLTKQIKSVEIGEFQSWVKYSDHVPLIVTF